MQTVWYLLVGLLFMGCTSKIDLEAERSVIHQMLQQEREAHFSNNVEAFLSAFADTTIQVNHGKVNAVSREDMKTRFTPYFESVTFSKWDDVQEPVITISDDGSMAYAAVEKVVVLTYPDSLGNPLRDSANYAWVSVYQKRNGTWKLVCNASTMEAQ